MSGYGFDEREMPWDVNAERGALGAMLTARDAVDEVSGLLKGPEFYLVKHQDIFRAAMDLADCGDPVDPVTVADLLGKRGELSRAGGPGYLQELRTSSVSPASAGYYAQIVAVKARRRGMISLGTRFVQMGYQTEDADFDGALDRAYKELAAAGPAAEYDANANAIALEEIGDELENPVAPGVMTGFKDLDALTDGMQPGDVWLVAASSGMGKSTFVADIHRHVSLRLGECSLMFSLEMRRRLVMKRVLCAEARIPTTHLRNGLMTERDWEGYHRSLDRISQAPFHIVDDFGITLGELKAKARAFARSEPLKFLSVDYLQKLTTGQHRPGDREQEIGAMSDGLKDLAGELNIPIVVAAQLNRGPAGRNDKTPQLSDLRESDRPVHDASVVIMPFREDYYERESSRAGEADLFVRKNRHGAPAVITVAFQGHYSKFCDFESARWSPSSAAGAP